MPFARAKHKAKTFLVIAILSNRQERFIKAFISRFPELKKAEYKDCGYNVEVIESFTFNGIETAKTQLETIDSTYKDHPYNPLHNMPNKLYCYKIGAINCSDLQEVQNVQKTVDGMVMQDIEEGILNQTAIAKKHGLQPYHITRIKNKITNN